MSDEDVDEHSQQNRNTIRERERERERERVQCAVLCGAVRCCVERGDREVISE